ncbi:MAG: hypothetical protein ACLGI9_26285 [Thermoanaerobaculia bacterium]
MSNPYATPPTVRVSAGTAVKIGFFGAIGAFLFSVMVSIVIGVAALVLAALGFGLGGLVGF